MTRRRLGVRAVRPELGVDPGVVGVPPEVLGVEILALAPLEARVTGRHRLDREVPVVCYTPLSTEVVSCKALLFSMASYNFV